MRFSIRICTASFAIVTAAVVSLSQPCGGSPPKSHIGSHSPSIQPRKPHRSLLSLARWVYKGSLDDIGILGWLSDREILFALLDRRPVWHLTAYNWITRREKPVKALSRRLDDHFIDSAPSSGIRYWGLSPNGKYLLWAPKYGKVYVTSIDGHTQQSWAIEDFASFCWLGSHRWVGLPQDGRIVQKPTRTFRRRLATLNAQ